MMNTMDLMGLGVKTDESDAHTTIPIGTHVSGYMVNCKCINYNVWSPNDKH